MNPKIQIQSASQMNPKIQMIRRVTAVLTATAMATLPASAAELLNIGHDGTSGDEGSPFDTLILSNSTDWTYTTDGARSVMTALDNATTITNNRLILVQANAVPEFTDIGTAADKGWVFEIELKILQGDTGAGSSHDAFAYFGVRSENGAGKEVWVGLTEDGGAGSGRIGFIGDAGNANFTGTPADLNVAGLIGDGQYHNFKMHKYDNAGTTTVDVFMDGSLVLTTPYSALDDDVLAAGTIQGFASATPAPLSEVNIDFINFTLYDTLTESVPDDNGTDPMLVSTSPADDAPNVASSADLVATFDEAILLGASGDVTIRNLTNPSDTVISLGGGDPDGAVTASSNQLTINPAADLAAGDEYAILIGSTVVEDLHGNAFAGIPHRCDGRQGRHWLWRCQLPDHHQQDRRWIGALRRRQLHDGRHDLRLRHRDGHHDRQLLVQCGGRRQGGL